MQSIRVDRTYIIECPLSTQTPRGRTDGVADGTYTEGGSHEIRSVSMKWPRTALALILAAAIVVPSGLIASNHREAPITALDHKADITDVYAFVSYGPSQSANTL